MEQGIYEQLLNQGLENSIEELKQRHMAVDLEPLDEGEAHLLFARYVEEVVQKALTFIREGGTVKKDQKLIEQINLCNQLIGLIADMLPPEAFETLKISERSQVLLSIYSTLNRVDPERSKVIPVRPATSIARSSLFTGSTKEPELVSELRKEIQSCDNVDMLVSFIKWSGLRLLYEDLKNLVADSTKKVRVITTCYMGATDAIAIEKLAELPNVEVRISYDVEHTRLHAKSYMFHRKTGFTTAYIGSSNMSKAAMTSGLEWNLKVTEKDSFEVIRKFQATFESYWNSPEFESYRSGNDLDARKLRLALRKEQPENWLEKGSLLPIMDIQPYPYQQEILDALQAERTFFHRNKNLVVAATGIGKTVIAAFDFRDFYKNHPGAKLLFVAHREEILKQSLGTFRMVLKDMNFGALMTGSVYPESIHHLFTTIQSFNSRSFIERTTEDFYDYIVVDEFHHAAAKSYQQLLNYYKSSILLGLTATPERMDGENVFKYFDHHIASEMRLPEAIDHKLLVPFHYFCVTDPVDLSRVEWTVGGYKVSELEHVYHVYHESRVREILEALDRYVSDLDSMKAIGFCAGVDHAKSMTKSFNQAGISAMSVLGDTDSDERQSAKVRLESGEIKIVFTVDVYNEGVDIPCINTVLFLRPTQSLTVFLQQLGRGLRHDKDKECLTVLDFVGQAHEKYRYEDRFRALLHRSGRSVKESTEKELFALPRGCHIKMEKVARAYILENIRRAILDKRALLSKIRSFQTESDRKNQVGEFVKYHGITMIDFYGKSGNRSFYTLQQEAKGLAPDSDYDGNLIKRYKNLFFLDSHTLIQAGLNYFAHQVDSFEDEKTAAIFYYSFFEKPPQGMGWSDMHQGLERIRKDQRHQEEILDILAYQRELVFFVGKNPNTNVDTPLEVHCSYTTNQILAGMGYYNGEQAPEFREGVLNFKEAQSDLLFITLNKSESEFSESTMYEDYPINERLFHWQSQSTVSANSATADRYRNHAKLGRDILLFVRDNKKMQGFTSPFIFMGKAHYVREEGSNPVSIVWRLEKDMPAKFLEEQLSLSR